MPARLVALDEGPDIILDRTMVVVGRHPQCDARLDSLRVSRHHCCMTQDRGELVVRDLGSTNGIRINGQRVEMGRLRTGDELSIAHIRYRLADGLGPEVTQADSYAKAPAPVRAARARAGLVAGVPLLGGEPAGGRRPRPPAGGRGRSVPHPGHRPDAQRRRRRRRRRRQRRRRQRRSRRSSRRQRRGRGGGPRRMSAQLVPLSGGDLPTIPIQRPVLLIGRHLDCDVRIDRPKVSRRHCCLALAYDRVMIRDLGSRNGLRVNGRMVEESQLRPGDEVAIGPLLYRLDVDEPRRAGGAARRRPPGTGEPPRPARGARRRLRRADPPRRILKRGPRAPAVPRPRLAGMRMGLFGWTRGRLRPIIQRRFGRRRRFDRTPMSIRRDGWPGVIRGGGRRWSGDYGWQSGSRSRSPSRRARPGRNITGATAAMGGAAGGARVDRPGEHRAGAGLLRGGGGAGEPAQRPGRLDQRGHDHPLERVHVPVAAGGQPPRVCPPGPPPEPRQQGQPGDLRADQGQADPRGHR